jgi:RecB family exonuclease
VLAWLAKRFGDDYRWSASGLEAYSRLPFQFLLERVLRYEEAKEADEEVTALVFGWMAHDLLERFYRQVKDDLPAEFTQRAEEAFESAAAEVLARAQADERWLGAAVLWEQQWKRIRGNVRAYLEWELVHLAYKGESPDLIEYSFGFEDDEVYIEGKDVAGLSARLRLCGRIDRVDLGKKGYQVLDYKSGGTPGANDYDDGTALQAPLYMQVLENAGFEVSKGYYRSLKPKKKPTQHGGLIERHKPKYDNALHYALSIPGRIRAGLFEPVASAKSKGWAPWHAGRDIARSATKLAGGNRYEDVHPLLPEPAPGDVAETGAAPASEPARLPFASEGGDDA